METDLLNLIRYLLNEDAHYHNISIPESERGQRNLLRSLMNVWAPKHLDEDFIHVQDRFLQADAKLKGIVDVQSIPSTNGDSRIALWQGDITRLHVDAIVNAANNQLLGCFVPLHQCIDNAIHSSAGLQLRNECSTLMQQQGHPEPTGQAKITGAYNLPSSYILHTVGPIIKNLPNEKDKSDLASCYLSCLKLCDEMAIATVAFCCISTGEFRFPNREAAEIAYKTVTDYLDNHTTSITKVIFNVYKDQDHEIYRELLG